MEPNRPGKSGGVTRRRVHDHLFDMDMTVSRPITFPGHLVALALLVGGLVVGYRQTLTPVTLVMDGQPREVWTHQETVRALLVDAGLVLRPQDHVAPALDTTLEAGMVVEVRRARPVTICVDGQVVTFYSLAASVEQFLREARVSLGPYDEIEVEGGFASGAGPVRVTVHRAVPVIVDEDGQATVFYTTAATVGEALRRFGLTLYMADGVEPGPGERVTAGMRVSIHRSVPVTVEVDGRVLRTRTHRERVDEVLADLGVVVTGQDYTVPPLDSPLGSEASVRVVRVSERFLIEQEPIPFETVWQPDPTLEIDQRRLIQEGARGILERRIRVRYEDGQQVARTVENEYVVVPPTTKIMGYGTNIVIRTLETPSGPVQYWRVIRMLATSYSASTAGTPRSSPWYGRTRTGEIMRFGIVAVDPRVIALRSRVYVPGYGIGYAGDTGGAIRGRRIDLGYDDDNLVLWYRWVDVYLLTPVPPVDQINYILEP